MQLPDIYRRLLIFLLLSGPLTSPGQDILFSQYTHNGLSISPAFAGVTGNMELFTAYRQERSGGRTNFETYYASFSRPSEWLHGGFGLSAYRDNAASGFFSLNSISLIYAYHLQLSRDWNLSAGFGTALSLKQLDTRGMILPDMIDPVLGAVLPSAQNISSESKFFFDFHTGFLFYSSTWYAGMSAFHLLEPQISHINLKETSLDRRYSLLIGRLLTIPAHFGRKSDGKLNFWSGYNKQGASSWFQAGVDAMFEPFTAGLSWQGSGLRQAQFLVPSLGIVTKNFLISYSYNVAVERRSIPVNITVHELTISYAWPMKHQLSVPATIKPVGF